MIVPRMYTRREFVELCREVPEDFQARTREFWDYVGERLRALGGQVRWVFRDNVTEPGAKGLSLLKAEDPESFAVVDALLERGAELRAVEDPLLLGEVKGWMETLVQRPTRVVQELLDASLRERLDHIAAEIERSLKDGEVGVLFLNPGLEVAPPSDARVIRMYPFHPKDYLVSSLAKQRAGPQPSQ